MAWERLAHVELSSSGDTLDSGTFTAKKNMKALIYIKPDGNTHRNITFNNDTGSNYTTRYSLNGGSDSTETSISAIAVWTDKDQPTMYTLNITNISDKEKLIIMEEVATVSGAGNAPTRSETVAKWANTSAQITSIKITNADTGDFDTGSYITVLGAKEASPADELEITGMEAKKFLKIQAHLISDDANTGSSTGSTGINTRIRVNGDTGSNYARRMDGEGAGYTNEGTSVNQDHLHIVDEDEFDRFTVIHVVNQANKEKIFMAQTVAAASNGTAVPSLIEAIGKWANTSNQITSIKIYNTGSGSMVEGSEVVVYGTD